MQLFPVYISIKVFEAVGVEGDDVRETLILTEVESAGTVNRYQTSRRVPQLPDPLPAVVAELYNVPVVGEQDGFTANVTALEQASFAGD